LYPARRGAAACPAASASLAGAVSRARPWPVALSLASAAAVPPRGHCSIWPFPRAWRRRSS